MASGDTVDQIKEKLSILDVVSPYVELHKAGKNYKGKSPFTSEKTPSFYVSPDRGMYYCFSSNQGGDIFTFIEKIEGVDFKGALKILAEKAGVELVREDPKKRSARDAQYALLKDAADFFFTHLTDNKEAEKYVTDRGVSGRTIHAWQIGLAVDAWRDLREHLEQKGYSEAQMLAAGLVKKSENAKDAYDVFRNRIMFPINDSSGRVVAFSGRALAKDPETPKYVNSPETELYQKSEILFGYDKAKQGIRQFDFTLIVEGQFDLVLAHQAGYSNTVAVSGTALTDHHVGLLGRLSNRVVLALDSDRAGLSAVKRAAAIMLRRGMDIKVVHMDEGADPADLIKEDPVQFKKKVGEARHVVEFLLVILKAETKDERAYKLRVREEVVPLLARMPNHIDREHFEGVIAAALDTTKDAIHYEVSRMGEQSTATAPQEERTGAVSAPHTPSNRRTELIRHVYMSAELLRSGEYAEVGKEAATLLTSLLDDAETTALANLESATRSRTLFTLEHLYEKYSERQLREELSDALNEIMHATARQRLTGLRNRIQDAERADNTAELERCLKETKEWEAQLQKRLIL